MRLDPQYMSSREGRAQDESDGGKLPVASRSRMSSEGASACRENAANDLSYRDAQGENTKLRK